MTSPSFWAVNALDANPERGICSLTYKGSTLRFRTNPNSIKWSYRLNTHVDTTYGGRVVQLLSTCIGDLSVVAEAGGGRWDYLSHVVDWFRDLLIEQRGGEPAEFAYSTRGWRLKVFAESIPFQDRLGDTLRSFEMSFKVQEDVSGLMSQWSLGQEIARLQDGIGFQRGKYNQPSGNYDGEVGPVDAGDVAAAVNRVGGVVGQIAGVVTGFATAAGNSPAATTIFGNPASGSTPQYPPGSTIANMPGFNLGSQSSGG